jgi:RNA polymerase sigma-70 factor, ECF subfamily
MDSRASTFQEHRSKLYGIAYRMLGTRADAEDTLQDAYLRWHQTDVQRVRSPEAWLTTTVAHLCIDRLRSERAKRETYVGPWLPEPLIGDGAPRPEQSSEQSSDLSIAFLVMLERLAPKERAAFLLHEVFDYDYGEIAAVLDKSESNVRQMVHRARSRVRRDAPRFPISEEAHRALLERFVTAVRTADRETLLQLFAEEATWTADGGGKAAAARKVLHGNAPIAKLLAGVGRQFARYAARLTFDLVLINGETGILSCLDGRPVMAIALVTDGKRISAGFNVLNPDKLARVPRAPFRRSHISDVDPPFASQWPS